VNSDIFLYNTIDKFCNIKYSFILFFILNFNNMVLQSKIKRDTPIPSEVRKEILDYINERLGRHEEIEDVFINQKKKNIFEVLVITKEISPKIEREMLKVEDSVENKYNVPFEFKTFSSSYLMSCA